MKRTLPSPLIEAANRAEATARLIRAGYRVYRPEADVEGEDLVLRRADGELIAVQLKSRLTVDWNRYGERGTWMLFPDAPWNHTARREWFLVPHDQLYAFLADQHKHTQSFAEKIWSARQPTKTARVFLEPFRLA